MKVFVSYSHEDREKVGELLALLNSKGVEYWLDEDNVRLGSMWPEEAGDAIRNSYGILLVWSIAASQSEFVRTEWNLGLGWKRAVVPALLDNTELPAALMIYQGSSDFEKVAEEVSKWPQPKTVDPEMDWIFDDIAGRPIDDALNIVSRARLRATSRLPSGASKLIGRDAVIKMLDEAWNDSRTKLKTLVAFGGMGKTSIVVEWRKRLSARGWSNIDAYFDWSFYAAGTDNETSSSDAFVAAALRHFDDSETADGDADPEVKVDRLVEYLSARRSLLVLDGLEPLQFQTGPKRGEIKDQALQRLLRGIAEAESPGLCVITSRIVLPDLTSFTTFARNEPVQRLSNDEGAELLYSLATENQSDPNVRASNESWRDLCEKAEGHPLTLHLIGRYIRRSCLGDPRHFDWSSLPEVTDEETKAWRLVAQYEKDLKQLDANHGDHPDAQLALLYILGLFDRPVEWSAVETLISGTPWNRAAALMALTKNGLITALSSLTENGLINLIRSQTAAGFPIEAYDAHPLVRTYFNRLAKSDSSSKEGHLKLYGHFKASVKQYPETIEELAPLYHAIRHGCAAGMHQAAFDEVYVKRTRQSFDGFSTKKLGAFASDLGALAEFFIEPWAHVNTDLDDKAQATIFREAGIDLRALGRLAEAEEPLSKSLSIRERLGDSPNASISAGDLSDLYLVTGRIDEAKEMAERALEFAHANDNRASKIEQFKKRSPLADALHQRGNRSGAHALFEESEAMQRTRSAPLLYARRGYRYHDLLVALGDYPGAEQRARTILNWEDSHTLTLPLDRALAHLALARALSEASMWMRTGQLYEAEQHFAAAFEQQNKAPQQQELPRFLIARARHLRLTGNLESALTDTNEAITIAKRGGMMLHLADAYLEHSRISIALSQLPEHYTTASEIVRNCHYERREPDLNHLKLMRNNQALLERQHVRPLREAVRENDVQLLLHKFSLGPTPEGGIRLDLHFDEETPVISDSAGKDSVQSYIAETSRLELGELIQSLSAGDYEHNYPAFPFRYASGGILPILQVEGAAFYCLFLRDTEPEGWNLANGGTSSVAEILDPRFAIRREFAEELILLRRQDQHWHRLQLTADEIEPDELDKSLALWRAQAISIPESVMPAKIELQEGPDEVIATFGSCEPVAVNDVFLSITPDDFGIELDQVARISCEVTDLEMLRVLDGEHNGSELGNRVVGLFNCDSFPEIFKRGETRFLPDHVFINGDLLPGKATAHHRSLDLCPVTRALFQRLID